MNRDNVFLDTDGEMTFESQERLNFIMHFMKKGAVEQVKQKSDGTFIREDAELSFSEIWLPCAQHRQSKIDELQKRIDEALTQVSNHYHSCVARKNLKRMSASVSEIAEIEAHESNMIVLENILRGEK